MEQQKKRIELLETMIANFDDGRSRSFCCKSAALLDLRTLENSLDRATKGMERANISPNDTITKAKILRRILSDIALEQGVELVKRK
jgi:hypothetical protein